MKPLVIGISGKRGCGKDTLAGFLTDHDFLQLSFAAELKKRVRQDFNLTTEHTDGSLKEQPTEFKRQMDEGFYTPRDIMIRCGFYYRSIDPLYWVKLVFKSVYLKSTPGYDTDAQLKFTISDVRFKNEADYIKNEGGILVRLERDPGLNIYKGKMDDPSETELDDYKGFDLRVKPEGNRTLTDLQNVAKYLEDQYGTR